MAGGWWLLAEAWSLVAGGLLCWLAWYSVLISRETTLNPNKRHGKSGKSAHKKEKKKTWQLSQTKIACEALETFRGKFGKKLPVKL